MSNCHKCNCDLGVEEFIFCDTCKDNDALRTRLITATQNWEFYRGKVSEFMGTDLQKTRRIADLEAGLRRVLRELEGRHGRPFSWQEDLCDFVRGLVPEQTDTREEG